MTSNRIPDTTRWIREYQAKACDLSGKIRDLDVEINAHYLKCDHIRAAALIAKREELVRQRNSARASIKQLRHAELLNPGLPRRRKSDQVLR